MTDSGNGATRDEVRRFGFLFASVCMLGVAYSLYAGSETWRWLLGGAVFFLATGLVGYPVLRPLYIGWMKLAIVLAWVNTRLLLGLFFYMILTPTGLVMRLFGKDFLDAKIDRSAKSYWKVRQQNVFDPKRYEQLF